MKLLRVLEERQIRRVGGNRLIPIDVRIIAATNKNLRESVEKKLFRDDLYYRLSAFEISIPPLRERKNDIRILVDRFCNEYQYHKKIPGDILNVLESYYWPGNVRQLRNAVEYMIQMSADLITDINLPDEIVEWYRKHSTDANQLNNYKSIAEKEVRNEPYIREIISFLTQAYENKENLGRRSLAKKLKSLGVFLTENEIRSILLDFEKMNLVRVKKGRSGTRLTKEGYETLKGWKG
jgi:transcriptional regulator with PAS, ATPase and Fis domain